MMATDRSLLITALNHPLRRKILTQLAVRTTTYTELLHILDVESGHLAYHLRSMAKLIDKGPAGYTLTPQGCEAMRFIEGEKENYPRHDLTILILATVFIIISLFSGTVIASTMAASQKNRIDLITHTQSEVKTATNRSLSLIYSVFEGQHVSRESWVEVMVESIELRSYLLRLSDLGFETRSSLERLDAFICESRVILTAGDKEYLSLCVERRQLFRDLHLELVDIQKNMEKHL
jgi:DNA-binding transcriptional ArsR family regulator